MGLRDVLQNVAQTAIAALGDIPVSTNYLAHVSTSYNASAGTPTTTYSSTQGVTIVFENFRIEQVDGQNVKPEDKRALVAAKDITGVTPGVDDVIIEGSTTWRVQRVAVDPAGALYELQVRKP